jgi:hypothetical protein
MSMGNKKKGKDWVRLWPLWTFLFAFLIISIGIFVASLVNISKTESVQRQVSEDCDLCNAKRRAKPDALGKDQSVFGSVVEIDSFLEKPTYENMVKRINHMCSLSSCSEDTTCVELCGTLKDIIQSIDNGTIPHSTSPPPSEQKEEEGVWKRDPSVSNASPQNINECRVYDRHYLYPSFSTSIVAMCFTSTNTESIVAKCLPLFSELCYTTNDSKIVSFCKSVSMLL